jgi:hypothetical protein
MLSEAAIVRRLFRGWGDEISSEIGFYIGAFVRCAELGRLRDNISFCPAHAPSNKWQFG